MNLLENGKTSYLLLNDKGLPVAGDGLSLAEAGPFIERLHEALERGETSYGVWEHGEHRFFGTSVGDGIVIVKCGGSMPLTKALYLLDDIRRSCRKMIP